MDRHTIIFATDKRQENLAMLLDGEKRNFVWEENVECEGVCEKIYVLPTPVSKLDKNPKIAICGDWFTAHGTGENMGHVLKSELADMMSKLRVLFEAWYELGHVDESDPDTVLLRIRLTDGVLFDHGTRYEIEFN